MLKNINNSAICICGQEFQIWGRKVRRKTRKRCGMLKPKNRKWINIACDKKKRKFTCKRKSLKLLQMTSSLGTTHIDTTPLSEFPVSKTLSRTESTVSLGSTTLTESVKNTTAPLTGLCFRNALFKLDLRVANICQCFSVSI